MEFSLYGKLTDSAALIPIRLERREPAHNRQRFYTIAVTRTPFDGWALAREAWFQTETAASAAGTKIRRQREKRGYCAVNRFEAA